MRNESLVAKDATTLGHAEQLQAILHVLDTTLEDLFKKLEPILASEIKEDSIAATGKNFESSRSSSFVSLEFQKQTEYVNTLINRVQSIKDLVDL